MIFVRSICFTRRTGETDASDMLRELLINKIPVFTWRGEAAPGENWDFTGILFYGKPLIPALIPALAN
jgi:hypothetical protein